MSRSTRTMSIDPSEAPASPIAAAKRANEPGLSSSRTRTVALKDAEGCMTLTVGAAPGGHIGRNYGGWM